MATSERYSVYIVTNTVNGKQYVGMTRHLKMRWYRHRKAKSAGSAIQEAIRLYGVDNFVFTHLMDVFNFEHAKELEKEFIAAKGTKFPNGYNLTDGGQGISGFVVSEETKRKIGEASGKRRYSEEVRQRMSEAQKKVVKPRTSEETKAKLSAATKRYWDAKKAANAILQQVSQGVEHEE
jgi:group I intron endonuclease